MRTPSFLRAAELRLEFQPPDDYYRNRKRWKSSTPLDSKLMHVAFAASLPHYRSGAWRSLVVPARLHEHMANMRVAGLGDPEAQRFVAGAVHHTTSNKV